MATHHTTTDHEEPARSEVPVLALGCAAGLIAVAAVVGRRLWFFSDDWNILADYHDGNLLEPFNGHLSLVPAGIYRVLFHTVGVDSYLWYRITGLVAVAVLAFQVVRMAHARLGALRVGRTPSGTVLAAMVTAAVLWNSSGKMNVLFPFLMNFSIPIAALIAIWWHLDRCAGCDGRSSIRHEVAASAWLVVALASSGLGLMTLVAVGVELLLSRSPIRRWVVLAPGPLLWLAWYATHRGSDPISRDIKGIATYSARMVLGATTSVGAGVEAIGVLLALAALAYFVLAGWRWRSLDPRSIGALAAPAAFVVFTAATRSEMVPAIAPDELRYSWAVAAYLVIAVVMASRGRRWFDSSAPRWLWTVLFGVGAAVLGLGAVRLVDSMSGWNEQVADARPGLSTVLFATEAIGTERIDPDVVIPLSYVPVTTGGYLEAVADVGSPIAGADADDLGGASYNRQVADSLLVEQLGIRLIVGGPEGSPTCEEASQVDGSPGEYELAPGDKVRLTAEAVVTARLARFAATEHATSIGQLHGGVGSLELPEDDPAVADMEGLEARWPYRLLVDPGVLVQRCR